MSTVVQDQYVQSIVQRMDALLGRPNPDVDSVELAAQLAIATTPCPRECVAIDPDQLTTDVIAAFKEHYREQRRIRHRAAQQDEMPAPRGHVHAGFSDDMYEIGG